MEHCVFSENTADPSYGSGGGLAIWASSPAIVNCTFHRNTAGDYGGGVLIGMESSASFVSCTMSDNQAPNGSCMGMFSAISISISNSILSYGYPGAAVFGTGNVNVSYCNVFGNSGGDWTGPIAGQLGINGNLCKEPLFVNRQQGDLHLFYHSPCRDSGDNSAPHLATNDFEGDPRIAYGTVDMGADENYAHLYWTGDAAPGGKVELKFVGPPGTSPVQLWLGSGIMIPPMTTKYGDWHLQFPLLANLGLGALPSPGGVLILPFTLSSTTPTPLMLPLQAGLGMKLTNLSTMHVE